MKLPIFLSGIGLLLLALLFACTPQITPPAGATPMPATASSPPVTIMPPSGVAITGTVLDPQGAPLPQATVRIQATVNETQTDDQGRFVLVGPRAGVPVTVSAWKDGYYCANVEKVTPPSSNIILSMRLVQTDDNPVYPWIPPTGENSCYSCKPGVTQVWLDNDAHGKSATNIRFLSMYNGTDVNGRQSPLTRYGISRDYGRIPLRPDLTQTYYGPGYKLDFPDSAGNCAACHTPGAAIDAPYGTDPNAVSGVNKSGVHCDYCHKVAGVRLDAATGLPDGNMPGVLSQDIRRPFPEDKARYSIFFGTFDDDNVPMEDTYLPLLKESQWCAPCHYGIFWDTLVYNSFGEWLASPYSDPKTGKTCQQCHMPAPTILNGQPITNVASGKGGVERDPSTIPAHTFPGASSTELLQNAVFMKVSGQRTGGRMIVKVSIVNDRTGHDVPTDSPLRQMILLVQARGPDGSPLTQVDGPTIPDYGGVGDQRKGYFAGLPGKIYAKILAELWTEITPTGAYWNPTRIVSDNRLAAFAIDVSTYTFAAPPGTPITVEVTLLYRRAFKQLMDQKGWDVPDIIMAHATMQVNK
jgi:hypothetical protein